VVGGLQSTLNKFIDELIYIIKLLYFLVIRNDIIFLYSLAIILLKTNLNFLKFCFAHSVK